MQTWTAPGPGARPNPTPPPEASTTANTPAECCVTQDQLNQVLTECGSGQTVVIQQGAAYPAPLPPIFQTVEFRGSVDPASQFTLNGSWVYKWVQLP